MTRNIFRELEYFYDFKQIVQTRNFTRFCEKKKKKKKKEKETGKN